MKDYLTRFDRMVQELIACDDKIAVRNYHQFEPALAEVIERVETELGFRLSDSIRAFFKLTNGLQLRWNFRSSDSSQPEKYSFSSEPFDWLLPWDDYLHDTGVINILPLEHIFLRDWKGFVWFESAKKRNKRQLSFYGVKYDDLAFKKAIKPFDAFDKFYSMAFFVGDRQSDSKVVLCEDHLADCMSSKVTNFESYLEFLLATKGIVTERRNFYSDEFNSSTRPKEILLTDAHYWRGKEISVCN